MLVYNGTPEQKEYFNNCVMDAIPLIKCFGLDDIRELQVIINKYHAEVLSRISVSSRYIYMMLNSMSNIQQGCFLPELSSSIIDMKDSTLNSETINRLQLKINSMTSSLNNIRAKIESLYSIPIGSLSLYSFENVDQGVNLAIEKNKIPLVLSFYEGRIVLKKIISLIENFLSVDQSYLEKEKSLYATAIEKPKKDFSQRIKILRENIDIANNLEQLSDACFLAIIAYTDCFLASKTAVDIFLNRKYDLIKEDILKESQKYL